MTKPYKHIIWDWNGTLLNDTWLCIEVLNGLLKRRGRAPISQQTYRDHFNFPVIHFYAYLGFDTDLDSFDQISREFIEDYEQRWLQECDLHPNASEVLTELTQRGITQSVLSAAKQEALDIGIPHFGLHDHFLGLVGTDNIHAKGKVAQGRAWVEQLHGSPQDIVLIGDTVHDYEVAAAIGTDCILISHGHHHPDRLVATGAPVINSLCELIESAP